MAHITTTNSNEESERENIYEFSNTHVETGMGSYARDRTSEGLHQGGIELRPISSDSSETTHTFVDNTSGETSVNEEIKLEEYHRVSMENGANLDLENGAEKLQRQKRLFSIFFGRTVPALPEAEEREPYPWLISNLLSQSIFFWIWPVLVKGYKRTLLPDDLWYLPRNLTVEDMHTRYRGHLNKIVEKHQNQNRNRNRAESNSKELDDGHSWPAYAIPYALFLTFKIPYTLSCIFLACSFTCQACAPLILKKLIVYVEYSYYGIDVYNESIGYTIGAVVLILINGLLLNHFFHNAMVTGAAAKSILTKDILLKSFRVSAKAKHKFTTGRVTSLMTTDLSRIDLAIGFQPLVLCFPIPVTIAVALLLSNIGVVAFAGIGLFIVSIAICVILTSRLFLIRKKVVNFTDARVTLMREVLNNLKIIKFYAWESAYKKSITETRKEEMRGLFKIESLRNSITAYAVTLPTLTSMVSFVTMWATRSTKSPSDVFSSLALFSILAQAVMLLPLALATAADAVVGFQRCSDYLQAHEFVEVRNQFSKIMSSAGSVQFSSRAKQNNVLENSSSSTAIKIHKASFRWESSDERTIEDQTWGKTAMSDEKHRVHETGGLEYYSEHFGQKGKDSGSKTSEVLEDRHSSFDGLHDISLLIKKGDFVVITGTIGSGKSSLLNALSGSMQLTNPETAQFMTSDDVLLCGEPWIQNATVRENIIFGKHFEKSYYDRVVSACCLNEDVKHLSHGDLTEIGEKGVTLSGGQKARICLARAVYHGSSILLFDDVLSAVDSRVGTHIITNLFEGLLKNHTRILATHQLSLVSSADKIVFMNGDGTIDVGTTSQLLQRNPGFRVLFEHTDEAAQQNSDTAFESSASGFPSTQPPCSLAQTSQQGPESSPALRSEEAMSNRLEQVISYATPLKDFGKTIEDEDVCINSVSWDVYKKYIQMGQGVFGRSFIPLFIFFVALSTFCQLFTNTWLSFWVEKRFSGVSDKFYVTVFVLLAILTVIFTATQFTLLAYMNNKSAKRLNVQATEKVLRVPMSFMDTNPLGRILNRFTKDTDALDNVLGEQLTLFVFPLATIIGIVILCISYLPWFAIAVPFLAFAFLFFTSLYSASSREIKRLEAVQRSVVYNNFNETLHGMATIKAYKSQTTFLHKNDYLLNRMNEAYFLSIAAQRWLCVHLDGIAAILALIVTLLCVTNQFKISASSTGLLLNYVIQIVGLLSLTVRAMTQVEAEMNSVERLHSYAFSLPQEAAHHKPKSKPPKKWPMSGYIQFKDVSLRYRPDLPLILKDLTFGIYPGEKVGICGRTGAGKSSIMAGLYRLNELASGSITIDGIDISSIGLRDLRSKLSIIPQDPVLFHGTIRSNLDPFQQYNDDILWDSLRRSGLIEQEEMVSMPMKRSFRPDHQHHKFHLDKIVDDDGRNFSLGEKQLIALARALVRDTKILILDEATSSVDYKTDAKIQETLVQEFKQSTTLCIAHRLRTIINYDRILVIDGGRVVERGVPWVLFQHDGLFKSMCDKAHISSEDFR